MQVRDNSNEISEPMNLSTVTVSDDEESQNPKKSKKWIESPQSGTFFFFVYLFTQIAINYMTKELMRRNPSISPE
jgi:hypothetical protein